MGAGVMIAALKRDWVPLPMRAMVLPDGREMGVPERVMTPPGVRVWPEMMKSDDASAVYDEPWNDNTAGAGVIAGVLLRD